MSDAYASPGMIRRLDPPDELQIRLLMCVPLERDICDILAAARSGEDELSREFDLAYVDDWARQLGPDVEPEWRGLQGQA